jgi:CheY-like chemotaxis protein
VKIRKPISVLIVDDNAPIRGILRRLFTTEEFCVPGEAANGQEAIERAEQLKPDLIVMDLSMPVMNGLQAAPVIHKLLPRVPIILFSEYADVMSDRDRRSTGASAVISKSAHAADLLEQARALVFQASA